LSHDGLLSRSCCDRVQTIARNFGVSHTFRAEGMPIYQANGPGPCAGARF